MVSQAWWLTAIIITLEKLGQGDHCKLEAFLGYENKTKVSIPHNTHVKRKLTPKTSVCWKMKKKSEGHEGHGGYSPVSSPAWSVLQRSNLHADGTFMPMGPRKTSALKSREAGGPEARTRPRSRGLRDQLKANLSVLCSGGNSSTQDPGPRLLTGCGRERQRRRWCGDL